jgi:hypothetical protein
LAPKWPEEVSRFISTTEWIFAKTYADTWPHEYLVKEQVNEHMFLAIVGHIRKHGYLAPFYQHQYKYFQQEGLVYWTMVPPDNDPKWYPINEENIINRCPYKNTYDYRLAHGTLP